MVSDKGSFGYALKGLGAFFEGSVDEVDDAIPLQYVVEVAVDVTEAPTI